MVGSQALRSAFLSVAFGLPCSAQQNVLVLLADDLGVDNVAAYGDAPDPPSTPRIDSLANDGVLFRNAWANPVCSPTRATLLTGRYAFRTGVGWNVYTSSADLPHSELTLPEMLDLTTDGAYEHGYFGKWHMSNGTSSGGPSAPNDHGWSWFEGTAGNLANYFEWSKVTNGTTAASTEYATTDVVDSTLEWIADREGPWLAVVAFHAAHLPYHAPPAHLHGVDLSEAGPPLLDPVPYFRAMVEAMDTEIGNLLDGLGPAIEDTVVIFVGDNGTEKSVVLPPYDPAKAKGTLYQGGVGVPLVVAGPQVTMPGAECTGLVNVTDLFLTVADLAGADLDKLPPDLELDSISIAPYLADPLQPSLRSFVYSEYFVPNGFGSPVHEGRAASDGTYKLVRITGQPDELYHLGLDPFELTDLLVEPPLTTEAALAYRGLEAVMRQLD